ncbi:hypothetical protein [Marinobacterium sp. xm-v-233]|uniref:hypothetical protein n=1 Tax=Marinobacterium sp. xm-v-233 TaxID=2497744 RepID=UPI0015681A76|nr:hypothetical protein [Marinobacterium sp. xm-v-233]NRQ00796.1 hypothetical protein [Marinobacterium sp. xm-v-233]
MALEHYYEALERLKTNKPIIVDKGSAVNRRTVALEAGMAQASIRPRRSPDMDELIAAIDEVAKAKKINSTKRNPDAIRAKKNSEIDELKAEINNLRSHYMSLLQQNFNLQKALKKAKQDVPKIGAVANFRRIKDASEVSDSEIEEFHK